MVALATAGGLLSLTGVVILYGTVFGLWPLGLVIAPVLFATSVTILLATWVRNPVVLIGLLAFLTLFLELAFRIPLWGLP